jgi:precorrin-6B methylase 2
MAARSFFFAGVRFAFLGALLVCKLIAQERYEVRHGDDPNGIDKYYMGRQIAHVMGHQGADWLERPTREVEEHTDEMINLLNLRPGENAADIGAGTGYITWRMAKKVAPTGKVYAVEIQQEMLGLISQNMKARGISNVVQTLGTVTDPKLPANALDLIVMVDVYHEFDYPYEMTEAMVRSLKPGGRLVFVEFRKEDPNVPIKEVHKMSVAQVKKEMSVQQLQYSETLTNLPWQHVIIFKKTGGKPRASLRGSESGLQPAGLALGEDDQNSSSAFFVLERRRLKAEPHTTPSVTSLDSRPARITIQNTTVNLVGTDSRAAPPYQH